MQFKDLYERYFPYGFFVLTYILAINLGILPFMSDGLYVTDESVYFLMVKSIAEGRPLEIWNGLDEIDSPALRFTTLAVVSKGRLYPQYPPLYAFIAYPFYWALGFHGLFLINLFAFSASVILLYLLVRDVFNDRLLAAASVVAFSLFTYALEFSIELWPHMLSVAMVLASFYLAIRLRKSLPGIFVAGFVSASAIGVRYQNVVFSALLFLYVLFECGFGGSVLFLAGLFVPLSAVLSINYVIFGGLTTGYSAVHYPSHWHFTFLFLALFFYCLVYMRFRARLAGRKGFMVFLVFALFALVFLQIVDSHWLERVWMSVRVVYAEVFDIGSFPLVEVYYLKTSLLQAAPFLVLAFFGVLKAFRENKSIVFLFILFSLAEIIFFSSVVGQHGERTLNMRFFLESVPFLAALSVYAVLDLFKDVARFGLWFYIAVFFLMLFAFILVNVDSQSSAFYRALPLVLAGYVFVLHLFRRSSKPLRAIYVAFVVVAFSYSFYMSLFDMASSKVARDVQFETYDGLCSLMGGETLVVYNRNTDITMLAPLRLCASPRFALVYLNETKQAFGLVEFYLNRGVPVYVINEGDEGQEAAWGIFAEELGLKYNHTLMVESDITLTRLNPVLLEHNAG
jgi:hypothetical protein